MSNARYVIKMVFLCFCLSVLISTIFASMEYDRGLERIFWVSLPAAFLPLCFVQWALIYRRHYTFRRYGEAYPALNSDLWRVGKGGFVSTAMVVATAGLRVEHGPLSAWHSLGMILFGLCCLLVGLLIGQAGTRHPEGI